jgi:murein DD-endopeptidase MepM/ murein hydrolase activator NlpD
MKKTKLYRFSYKSLTFQEARWTRTCIMVTGLLVGGLSLWLLITINQNYGDYFGFGFIQQNALVNENRVLQSQLQFLTRRLDGIQKQLSHLGDKGNELRLISDLPKLDDDLRKAGTGGTEERIDFTSSLSVNTLLNKLRATEAQAERELRLQTVSYEEVEKAYDNNKVRFSHLPAIKPMDGFYNKHDFGMRFHPILHIRRPHEGIDILNEIGTSVYAAAEGVVEFAGRQGGYGIAVEINHGYSLKTLYGHLSKILVHDGQRVKRGDLIAQSGNTGLSSGPHLHYEVRVNGVAQNPTDYFFDDVTANDLQKVQ